MKAVVGALWCHTKQLKDHQSLSPDALTEVAEVAEPDSLLMPAFDLRASKHHHCWLWQQGGVRPAGQQGLHHEQPVGLAAEGQATRTLEACTGSAQPQLCRQKCAGARGNEQTASTAPGTTFLVWGWQDLAGQSGHLSPSASRRVTSSTGAGHLPWHATGAAPVLGSPTCGGRACQWGCAGQSVQGGGDSGGSSASGACC